MPRADVHIAEEFIAALSEVYSDKILGRIENVLRSLQVFPEMGSPIVRPSLTTMYGEGLRQITISTQFIVYRYDGKTVDVLALVYGPRVV